MPVAKCREGQLLFSGPHLVPGLPEELRISAYLPPGYSESAKAYPLAIFFDGQNLFADEGSFRGGWHLHHLLDVRSCRKVLVPIVVAIHTDGWSRTSILSPWSEDPGMPALGDRFLEWVTGSLIPTIRSEVRALPGPEYTLIGGSSLGGLLSLYAFFRYPEVFGKALAMSPSLGDSTGQHGPIFPFVANAQRTDGRIYLDAGGRECPCGHVLRHAEAMAELLAHKGFEPGRSLMWYPDPDGDHDELHWRRRLPHAVQSICNHAG